MDIWLTETGCRCYEYEPNALVFEDYDLLEEYRDTEKHHLYKYFMETKQLVPYILSFAGHDHECEFEEKFAFGTNEFPYTKEEVMAEILKYLKTEEGCNSIEEYAKNNRVFD